MRVLFLGRRIRGGYVPLSRREVDDPCAAAIGARVWGEMMAIQPLRFAMVTTFYPPFGESGGGRAIQNLSRALVDRGHRVDVIHDTDLYRLRHGAAELGDDPWDGVHVHQLTSEHNARARLSRRRFGKPAGYRDRLLSLMSRDYDVIHFHNLTGLGGPSVWPLGAALKLHSAHDHWLVCPSADLMRDGRRPCPKARCTTCMVRQGRMPSYWRNSESFRAQARHVDAFVVPTRSARKSHRAFGFDTEMAVVPPFLPRAAVDLRATGALAAHPRPYYLYVGPLEMRRGLGSLIDAMDHVADADVLIVGAGPDAQTLTARARTRRNIHFIAPDQVIDRRLLLRQARALVLPGRGGALFPEVVAEAFREGTPLIAGPSAPFPEIARDTGGAVICRTTQALADAMVRLGRDTAHLHELGRNAFDGAARLWREDAALAAYFDVIAEAAQRRGMSALMEKLDDRHDQMPTGTRPAS